MTKKKHNKTENETEGVSDNPCGRLGTWVHIGYPQKTGKAGQSLLSQRSNLSLFSPFFLLLHPSPFPTSLYFIQVFSKNAVVQEKTCRSARDCSERQTSSGPFSRFISWEEGLHRRPFLARGQHHLHTHTHTHTHAYTRAHTHTHEPQSLI
jgi:hypothetical protein